jgi:hypothetical protein
MAALIPLLRANARRTRQAPGKFQIILAWLPRNNPGRQISLEPKGVGGVPGSTFV